MVSTDGSSIEPEQPGSDDGKKPLEKLPKSRLPADAEHAPSRSGNGLAEKSADSATITTVSAKVTKAKSRSGSNRANEKKSARNQTGKPRSKSIDRLVMEFQPDAVEMEHRKVAGGLRWTLYTAIALIIAAVVWATWAKVDRIVVAEGKLISTLMIVIQPPTTSPIRQFNVQFGQTVRTGDVLFTLDPTFSAADVAKLESQANGLTARMARLTAEQAETEFFLNEHDQDSVWLTEQMVFLDRSSEMESKKQQFAAEHRKLLATRSKHVADVNELEGRLKRVVEKRDTTKNLTDKTFGTRTELLDDEIQVGFVQNQLTNAKNSILEADADLESLGKREAAERSSRKAEVSNELAKTGQDFGALKADLDKARHANKLVTIQVPEYEGYDEFVVVEVAERDVGSVVSPGDSLVRLIPAGIIPELECRVESKDIASIRETEDGTPRSVRIKLSAFPYMEHGTLEGVIRAISEDAFQDEQQPQIPPYYKVRIEITNFDLQEVRDNHRLIPGMAVTGEIKVGTRRVIDYFLYPLFRSLDSSIREP